MSRIALVTDSSAHMPPELVRKSSVHVIPVYIESGGETYRDGVDIDATAFYERLTSIPGLPTTSQPSVGDFVALYHHLSAEADTIVSIHISSGISGTVSSAITARQQLLAEMANPPEIYVIDSRTCAHGLALSVTAAARDIAEGTPAAQVAKRAETLASRLSTIFVVDTLEYLRKGGRIGDTAALVGSVLKVKPVLHFNEGRIDVLEKVRTARKAKQRLLEIVAERAGKQPIHACIVHAQVPQEAERIRQHLAGHFECRELFVVEFSPAIAVHVGPGTVGVAFLTAEAG